MPWTPGSIVVNGVEVLPVSIQRRAWRDDDAPELATGELKLVGRCYVNVTGGGRFEAFELETPAGLRIAAFWVRTADGVGKFATLRMD